MAATIQDDMWEAAETLPRDQADELIGALVRYGMTGEEPEGRPAWLGIFIVCRGRMAMSAKASAKGRKMARARHTRTDDAQAPCTDDAQAPCTDDAQAPMLSRDKSEKRKDPPKGGSKRKPERHRYGEYQNVLLSDDELSRLKAEYPDWEERIERLSGYVASKGASYKSHYATIRNWARKDAKAVPAKEVSAKYAKYNEGF